MTREEAETLVGRFNQFDRQNHFGCLKCTLISYEPAVFAYEFDTAPNAENFIMEIQLITNTIRRVIDPSRINRVIEYR